jgi:hypothetical protein
LLVSTQAACELQCAPPANVLLQRDGGPAAVILPSDESLLRRFSPSLLFKNHAEEALDAAGGPVRLGDVLSVQIFHLRSHAGCAELREERPGHRLNLHCRTVSDVKVVLNLEKQPKPVHHEVDNVILAPCFVKSCICQWRGRLWNVRSSVNAASAASLRSAAQRLLPRGGRDLRWLHRSQRTASRRIRSVRRGWHASIVSL